MSAQKRKREETEGVNKKKKKTRRTCIHNGCFTQANFGKEGSGVAEYCAAHKRPEDVNVKDKKCRHEGCKTIPVFGKQCTGMAEYCATHKRPEDVNVKNKKCRYEGCKTNPSFGKEGSRTAEFCAAHKRPDDVDIKSKRCQYEACKKQPTFGKEGSRTAEFCAAHKRPEDVNVIGKRCRHEGCKKQPAFGKEGTRRAEYCAAHKRPEDLNVISKRCRHEGCKTRPTFGKEGTEVAEYCAKHKRPEDVDIKNKKCLHEGCKKQPIFGKEGTEVAEYCAVHKQSDDVNVMSKQCQHEGCNKQVSYGPLFRTKAHCAEHRLPNEYLKSHPSCSTPECDKRPCYTNEIDNFPIRCESHKLPQDKNVVEQACGLCKDLHFIREGNLCNGCSNFTKKKIIHTKELAVKAFLESKGLVMTHDKRPQQGCFKLRPDLVLDYGSCVVITEVDEFEHKRGNYTPECERTRMINLHEEYEGQPVFFIRFNPDAYIDHLGKKYNDTGTIGIYRLERLYSLITSLKHHPVTVPLSVCYLYYDGDDGTNHVEEIKIYN